MKKLPEIIFEDNSDEKEIPSSTFDTILNVLVFVGLIIVMILYSGFLFLWKPISSFIDLCKFILR